MWKKVLQDNAVVKNAYDFFNEVNSAHLNFAHVIKTQIFEMKNKI